MNSILSLAMMALLTIGASAYDSIQMLHMLAVYKRK